MKSCDEWFFQIAKKMLGTQNFINSMVPTMEGRSINMVDYVGMLVTGYGGCLHQTMNIECEFMNTDSWIIFVNGMKMSSHVQM